MASLDLDQSNSTEKNRSHTVAAVTTTNAQESDNSVLSIDQEANVVENDYILMDTCSCSNVAPQNFAPQFKTCSWTKDTGSDRDWDNDATSWEQIGTDDTRT